MVMTYPHASTPATPLSIYNGVIIGGLIDFKRFSGLPL
jgi:hypothetical protein